MCFVARLVFAEGKEHRDPDDIRMIVVCDLARTVLAAKLLPAHVQLFSGLAIEQRDAFSPGNVLWFDRVQLRVRAVRG